MNRYVLLRTRDFKSRASASFATRAGMKSLKILHQFRVMGECEKDVRDQNAGEVHCLPLIRFFVKSTVASIGQEFG